jgi:hypothetical protein
MERNLTLDLNFQPYIYSHPLTKEQMIGQSVANDRVTIETFRKTWSDNIIATKKRFGSFKDRGLHDLLETQKHKPVIIAGSGSSLKLNAHLLKNRGDIALISCLHNYGFFEDQGIIPDAYISLDAQDVVVPEMANSGKESFEYYVEKSKDRNLLAVISSPPKLFDSWKGNVKLFNVPTPDPEIRKLTGSVGYHPDGIECPSCKLQKMEPDTAAVEPFAGLVSCGGNALGACMYVAKAVMGAGMVIFVGADFSFGYEKKFHAWDSEYDKKYAGLMQATDIFGMKVMTWPSYYNFKIWFELVATYYAPGFYVNCTEGGILGAYETGNIIAIQQMGFEDCLKRFHHYHTYPEINGKKLDFNVQDTFRNPDKGQECLLY